MATQKMKFAVEDIKEVDNSEIDKSQFSLLRVDAFATGRSAHDTFVTEETLRRTAKSILLKPFVFAVDSRMDDLGGHDPTEVAGGFVPHNTDFEFKTLSDGRVMLSVNVLVWKRYSGKLLEYFNRDGKKKSVSVEIEIFKSRETENGLLEILDYCYDAITALGQFISPAIPDAKAVMQFSKEFEEAKKEYEMFSRYDEVDMTIPPEVKQNAQKALDFYKESGKKMSTVALANARYLVKNEKITPQRMRQLYKNVNKSLDEDTLALWGGNESKAWSSEIVQLMDEIDVEQTSYYSSEDKPEEFDKETNVEVEQDDSSQDKEDMSTDNYLGLDEKKEEVYMEDVKDKNEEMAAQQEDMAKEEEAKSEDMAEEESPEKEEEEKEDMAADSKVYSLSENLDVAVLLKFLEAETKNYRDMKELADVNFAVDATIREIAKGNEAKLKGITNGMLDHMQASSKILFNALKQNKTLVEENKALKEFKDKAVSEKKNFEVEAVLKEAFEAGMPQDQIDSCRDESKKFSLEEIDGFKNMVKAKAFQYFGKRQEEEPKESINRIAYPFSEKKYNEPVLWK